MISFSASAFMGEVSESSQVFNLQQLLSSLGSLAKQYETRTDRLMWAKTKMLEVPAERGHFSDRSWENPGRKRETELPVVREATGIVEEGKETGRYVSEERNPLGEGMNKALLYVYGDRHITGSNPGETVESRSPVIHAVESVGPQTLRHRRKGEDWGGDERPRRTVDAARAIFETVRGDISHHDATMKSKDSAVALVNVGDDGGTEFTLGDYAYVMVEDDAAIGELENVMKNYSGKEDLTLKSVRIPGNHDSDVNNKGMEVIAMLRDFYTPPFVQEVGTSHMLLAIDTNLGSSFWFRSIMKELQVHPDQAGMAQWAVAMAEEQKALITQVLDKAKKNGRDVIVIGHDEEIIRKLIPLEKTTVTHIISGHYHSEKLEKTGTKNVNGTAITRVRVGAPFIGAEGWDKEQPPVSYAVDIDPARQNPVEVTSLPVPEWTKEAHLLT